MKLVLDTHLLLWSVGWRSTDPSDPMPAAAAQSIDDPDNDLIFSAASIWEVAIKSARGRADFAIAPETLRRGLLDHGYDELPVTSEHAVAVPRLPTLHKDPFDRLLIAQCLVEGITLLTADEAVARYPGPIRRV